MIEHPYHDKLGDKDPLTEMAAMPGRVAAVLTSLGAERVDTPAKPGKWSAREVVAHMADFELAFGFRLRQAVSGQAAVQPFDQDDWSKTYAAYPTDLAMATLRALRAWNLALAQSLTDTDKRMPLVHPDRGQSTVWDLVQTMAGHDLHHLEGLDKL